MRAQSRRGFTLIELLVVIAIIAILVALLLPAVQQVREAARKSQCQDHLHNIAVAIMDYEVTYQFLPAGSGINNPAGKCNANSAWGWAAAILPFNEQKPAYDALEVGRVPLYDALGVVAKEDIMRQQIDVYACPSDNSPETNQGLRAKNGSTHNRDWNASCATNPTQFWTGTANYVGVAGHKTLGNGNADGCLGARVYRAISDISDGTSNTLLIGERDQECSAGTWVGVRNTNGSGQKGANYVLGNTFQAINGVFTGVTSGARDTKTCIYGFSSKHPGGTQFALGDAKVTFLSENIDSRDLYCTNNGATCDHQNRDRLSDNAGNTAGVYQRLGDRRDGIPVSVP